MRLSNKIIEELVSEIAGGDTVPLVQRIKDKVNVSEFKIAENLKITVNQVRNILYRLQAHNLVSFIRKKDKKKGWYIYYWTFDQKQARNLALELKKQKLELLMKMLNREVDSCYFICPDSCVRFNFENAMEHQFKCPECNRVLVQEDNIKRLESLRMEIKGLEEEIAASKVVIPSKKLRYSRRAKKKILKPPKKRVEKKKKAIKYNIKHKKKKFVKINIPKPKIKRRNLLLKLRKKFKIKKR